LVFKFNINEFEIYNTVSTIRSRALLYCLMFGGMWRCLSIAVARVFALVVRCRVMMLIVYYRVGKNRDTSRESPAAAGAGRTAGHLTVFFSQKILAVRKGNDIYRPVSNRALRHIISAIHAIICAEGIKINCARTVPNILAKTI